MLFDKPIQQGLSQALPDLVEADVSNPDVTDASLWKCLYRLWTMSEILTAIITAGFTIVRLDEHPDPNNLSISGPCTLLALS